MTDELNNDLVYDIQYEDDYSISCELILDECYDYCLNITFFFWFKYVVASPEMISGHNYNPECSDLWCLGILLFTMIHADVPFKNPFDTIVRS
ncbi:hypothetical protein C2G38_1955070 [Gigaspora rosea]|uniref:Protein kinase domain-containing protein n=1 Tax=Gigaspora rosea TaxID=44941 RepID=A0A397VZC0_9GLOM|nr:hypothetical protein C2G38_1955070 [Gigaspora rosea]